MERLELKGNIDYSIPKLELRDFIEPNIYRPFFMEFDEVDIESKPNDFQIGQTYSIINEIGDIEIGKCVDYNPKTGRIKLEKIDNVPN